MPKVSLKSGKETFQLQFQEADTFEDFQAKVFALTDIPPKNLKALFKGKMIKDLNTLKTVPDGAEVKIMGTKAGNQLKKTDAKIIQAMEIEQARKPPRFGIVNVGNTCYMNSSLQFLRSVPEIKKMIKGIKADQTKMIPSFLGEIFRKIQTSTYEPMKFAQTFLMMNPEFQPVNSQHDADQFMQKVIDYIQGYGPEQNNLMKKTFEIQIVETITNTQIPDESPKYNITTSNKIGCSLGGTQTKIGTMTQGIRMGLETTLQKKSDIDNQNHIYQSVSKFNSLPPYLIVQMVRFFWKQVNDPESRFSKPVATKICKPVDFSSKIDLFEFCCDDLKEKLIKGRQIYEQSKKKEEENFKLEFQQYKNAQKDSHRPEARILEEFKQKKKAQFKPLTQGLQTGMYQINAIVTHLGRSIDSGHYMAWVRQNQDQWTKYDDDTVYEQPSQKVYQLRGGQPNLQIGYLFMFRKIYAKQI